MTAVRVLGAKHRVHRLLGGLRRASAAVLRQIPPARTALGLARFRIRSLPDWIEAARLRTHWVARGKGPFCDIIAPRLLVTRRAPTWVLGDLPAPFVRERLHLQSPLFLARLPDARVLAPGGTVVTQEGGLVEESTWWVKSDADRAWSSLHLPRTTQLPGHYLTIAGPSVEGYAHWIMDALPRLFGFERLGIDDMKILVPQELTAWQEETVRMLGLDPERFVPIGNRDVRVQFLYLPSHVGSPGNLHPWGCRWLRERLLGAIEPKRRDRRLYVTRRRSTRRRVVNEDAIEPILRDFGFEIVETENLGMREKAQLFAEAEMVAGPHGAGLTNILFAPPGCRVVEIFDPGHVNVLYYSLADLLDQPYGGLFGTASGGSMSRHQATGHDDIFVQPDEFSRVIDVMLATPAPEHR